MDPLSRHFSRRPILGVAAAVLLSATSVAWAQGAGLNKPVKIGEPFAPGGTTDLLAGAIVPDLSKTFGQSLIIDNKGGAGVNLGAEQVAKTLASPAMKERLATLGAIPSGNTSAQFAALIESEHKKWAEVVKVSGAKVD